MILETTIPVEKIRKGHPFFNYNFQIWSQRQRFLLQARREDEQIYKLKGFPIGDFH